MSVIIRLERLIWLVKINNYCSNKLVIYKNI